MRRRRDERGAVIVLVSLIMTVLLIVVSFAIDLGTQRATKRDTQAVADLAALDAGFFLSGSAPGALGLGQPRAACIAGMEALQRNVPGFLAGPAMRAEIEDRCNRLPLTVDDCVVREADPLTAMGPIPPIVDGERTVTIRYPVHSGELNTGQFTSGGARDGLEPCERMGFDLTKTMGTTFAKVIGVGELSTGAGAVVRGTTEIEDLTPPAVLLLERTECGVLTTNAPTSSGNHAIEIYASEDSPGLLHADSNGTHSSCQNNTTANSFVIHATSTSFIRVTDGNGTPPRLGAIRTAATNGRSAHSFPQSLSVAPTLGGVVSRKIVDDKYNSAANPAIKKLHDDAYARLSTSGAPSGHATVDCTQAALDAARIATHTKAYVNCASVTVGLNFTGFTDVVISGNVNLNGATISFPGVTTVTIHGSVSVESGALRLPAVRDLTVGGGVNVKPGGSLSVNSESATSCAGREGVDGWKDTTRFAIFGGSPALQVESSSAMCQTTVYLAGPKTLTTHVAQQIVSGGSCTPTKPCPRTGTTNVASGATLSVQKNGNLLRWSAPNQSAVPLPAETQGLEDLALWTEGAGSGGISSNGVLLAAGVFFAPNMDFSMSSPAVGAPVDAQFVSRKFAMTQGSFKVSPNPNNAVMVPTAGVYGLIR